MKAYHNSVVLRNDGQDTATGKFDLNAGATKQVTVRINSSQALAIVYDLDEVQIANPVTTDNNGNYKFKAADDIYDVIISEGGPDEYKIEKVDIVEVSSLIKDLSQAYVFGSIPIMQSSLIAFPIGKSVKVSGENGQYINFIVTNVNTNLSLVGGNFAQRLTDYQGGLIADVSDLSSASDNRAYVYGLGQSVFVAEGYTIRVNLLPDDDVRIFKGQGTVLSLDPFGNEQTFSIALSSDRYNQKQSLKQKIYTTLLRNLNPRVGIIGDSITSGDDSDSWSPNPIDGDGNLNSTNYDHDSNGGANGFFAVFRDYSGNVTGVDPKRPIETFNASRSGEKLINGWAYKNFDYGFFQNAAYQNAPPNVCFLSMGHNDSILTLQESDDYLDAFDAFMAKCSGYGSSVGLISTSMANVRNDGNESFKDTVSKLYGVDWYDLGSELITYAFSGNSTVDDIYYKGPTSTDYDYTHPLQIGHTFMGLSLLSKVFDTRLTTFSNGEIGAAVNTAKHISYNASNKVKAATNSVQFSDEPYLSDFGPVGKCTTAGNTAFDFMIENKIVNGVLNVTIPRPAATDPTTAPATLILKNANGETIISVDGDRGTVGGYYTLSVPELDFGINMITVFYDSTGITGNIGGYAPMLNVTKPVKSSSISQYYPDISDDRMIALTDAENEDKFQHDRYDGSIGSRLTDRDSDSRYGIVSVRADYVQGMRFWIARKPDVTNANGTYVEFTNTSTLTVKNFDGTVLATKTGLTITDEVFFRIKIYGNLIYLLSNAGQVGGWQRRGGLMYLENKSGSATGDYNISVCTAFNKVPG